MKKRKNTAIIIAAALVVALVGSIVLTWASHDGFTYVADSYLHGENVYVIDDDGENIDIIKANSSGHVLSTITKKKIHGDTISSFDYLTVDGDNVYVYRMDRNILSNAVLDEKVYLCNFGSGKLEEAWSLPITDESAQNNFAINVRGGVLTYFTVGYDTTNFAALAVLNTLEQDAVQPVKTAVAPYDIGIGFTDFYYSADGSIIFTTPEGNIFKANEQTSMEPVMDMAALPVIAGAENSVFEESVDNGDGLADGLDAGLADALALEAAQPEPVMDPQEIANEQLKEPEAIEAAELSGIPEYYPEQIYPTADYESTSVLTSFTADGQNSICYMDAARGGLFALDVASGDERTIENSWGGTDESSFAASDLKNIRVNENSEFTATISRGMDEGILGIYTDGALTAYESFTPNAGEQFKSGALYFVIILGALLLITILAGLVFVITKGKFPIVAKVIAVCIPVVVISILVLQSMMNSVFTQQITDSQYKELYLVSQQQAEGLSTDLISEIDMKAPFNSMYYYELRTLLTALPSESDIYESDESAGSNQVYDFGYHWLYKPDNSGKLVAVYCDQNYIEAPIEYYYDAETSKMFYDAARTGKTYRGSYRDVGGEWICLAIPVMDENGDVAAVLETGTTKAVLEYAVSENAKKINSINLAILIVLVVLLSALLVISLAPLKKLKTAIDDIIHGNLGVQTPVRGNDEISEISDVFNQMSTSIEYHVNELNQLNEGYFKFVPSKMFSLLRKSSVIDVRLGDQMNSDITILTFNAVDFDGMISSMNSGQMFTFINEIYSKLVPIVTAKGGVIDKFENAGLIAFFTRGSEDAVDTAVSVCQTMEAVNNKREAAGLSAVNMTSGISYGPVMVGIVGHEQRLAATTVSEHTNLSGYLRKVAPKYCSRILTTASSIDHIEGFNERFNARFIGFLHVTANNTTEKLYDVFDGDQEDIKLLKKQTKELFEKGVALYCERDYYEARLVFIDVLKKFRQDSAAKEYLYRCDMYYQRADNSGVTGFIEEY